MGSVRGERLLLVKRRLSGGAMVSHLERLGQRGSSVIGGPWFRAGGFSAGMVPAAGTLPSTAPAAGRLTSEGAQLIMLLLYVSVVSVFTLLLLLL